MKAVIFDADGTLIDSMSVWDNIGKNYLISKGIVPEPEVDEIIMTMSFADSCTYFIQHYGIKNTVEEMIREISDMVADKYRFEIPLKDGAAEYVSKLYNTGVKMCVLTGSERNYITDCLKRLGIYEYFEFIMTCSEEGLDKNSHYIYDRAAARMGSTPGDTLVFEDAFNAAAAAKQGGYTVYAVYDKSMEAYAEQIKHNCDKYIVSFNELKL